MEDRVKLTFDFALTATKQLITLSTAIIAFTVTFSGEYLKNPNCQGKGLAIASWILFILSVFFGLWTILALTGTLADEENPTPSINGLNVKIPSLLQILTFLSGLVLAIIFSIKSI